MEETIKQIEYIKSKESYDFDDLLLIMQILRSDDGCPWDREQTHESIRHNLIEETYEAAEAIDRADTELLKEELGDVLLQVVFHSKISEESGEFCFDEICDGVCRKLVRRHPHIFADAGMVGSSSEMLDLWEKIKIKEKQSEKCSDELERVAKTLPSLSRGQKMVKKAMAAGLYSPEYDEKAPIADRLMALCALSQMQGLDAEEELRLRLDRFTYEIREKEKEKEKG